MNTQQAYINGFVKRANEYGFSEVEAAELLKKANIDPSILRMILPELAGGLAGTMAFPEHPIAGAAGGTALGAAVGIPWGLHHLKSRAKKQYQTKDTAKKDREALEHYYPELTHMQNG